MAVTTWLHSSPFLYVHHVYNDLLKTKIPVDFKPYKGRDCLFSCSILRTCTELGIWEVLSRCWDMKLNGSFQAYEDSGIAFCYLSPHFLFVFGLQITGAGRLHGLINWTNLAGSPFRLQKLWEEKLGC